MNNLFSLSLVNTIKSHMLGVYATNTTLFQRHICYELMENKVFKTLIIGVMKIWRISLS